MNNVTQGFFGGFGLGVAIILYAHFFTIDSGRSECWRRAAEAKVPHAQMIATCMPDGK